MTFHRLLFAASFCLGCHAQVVNVTPQFECVQRSFGIASYGYVNINAQTITVPIGFNNFFLQFPLDQGQPTTFLSGDYYHVFLTAFDPAYGLTWSLDGAFADADTSSQVPTCPAAFIDPQFAPIGIAPSQTLRVKAVGNSSGTCNLNIGVANGLSKKVVLNDGQVQFIDIAGSNGSREEFLPVASVVSGIFQSCQVSAEVYESQSGVSVTSETPQVPQYQPIFASQAVAAGQTLRVGVTAPVNPGCTGTISFQDGSGNPLGGTQLVTVTAGQTSFLDLPSSQIPALRLGAAKRIEVLPLLTVPTPVINTPNVSVCLVSAEIFDSMSGETRTISIPQALP